MNSENLDMADGVLEWARVAQASQLANGKHRDHVLATAAYLAECVRLRQVFESLGYPERGYLFECTDGTNHEHDIRALRRAISGQKGKST